MRTGQALPTGPGVRTGGRRTRHPPLPRHPAPTAHPPRPLRRRLLAPVWLLIASAVDRLGQARLYVYLHTFVLC
jgi:hypothetical protein